MTASLAGLAPARGRARLSLRHIGAWRIAGGVLLCGLLLFGHKAVIGVSPLIP